MSRFALHAIFHPPCACITAPQQTMPAAANRKSWCSIRMQTAIHAAGKLIFVRIVKICWDNDADGDILTVGATADPTAAAVINRSTRNVVWSGWHPILLLFRVNKKYRQYYANRWNKMRLSSPSSSCNFISLKYKTLVNIDNQFRSYNKWNRDNLRSHRHFQ